MCRILWHSDTLIIFQRVIYAHDNAIDNLSFFYFYIDKVFGVSNSREIPSCSSFLYGFDAAPIIRFSVSLVEASSRCLRQRYQESLLLPPIFISINYSACLTRARFCRATLFLASMQRQSFSSPSFSSKLLHIASSSCLIIFKLCRLFLLDAHQRYIARTNLRLGCKLKGIKQVRKNIHRWGAVRSVEIAARRIIIFNNPPANEQCRMIRARNAAILLKMDSIIPAR